MTEAEGTLLRVAIHVYDRAEFEELRTLVPWMVFCELRDAVRAVRDERMRRQADAGPGLNRIERWVR